MTHSKDVQQLQAHTFRFAQAVRDFGKVLPMTVSNVEDLKQLIRASGAIGAKYLASIDAPSRIEYLKGIKDCGLEAKGTQYWLGLVDTQGSAELEHQRQKLMKAAQELLHVFANILQKTKA